MDGLMKMWSVLSKSSVESIKHYARLTRVVMELSASQILQAIQTRQQTRQDASPSLPPHLSLEFNTSVTGWEQTSLKNGWTHGEPRQRYRALLPVPVSERFHRGVTSARIYALPQGGKTAVDF